MRYGGTDYSMQDVAEAFVRVSLREEDGEGPYNFVDGELRAAWLSEIRWVRAGANAWAARGRGAMTSEKLLLEVRRDMASALFALKARGYQVEIVVDGVVTHFDAETLGIAGTGSRPDGALVTASGSVTRALEPAEDEAARAARKSR
jgi:hypothetical protein